MGRKNHICKFGCDLWKKTLKSLLLSEALIPKISFAKIPSSSTQPLDSLSPLAKMSPTKFLSPAKQQFSFYNLKTTSFLAVVVAPVPLSF